MSENSQGSVTGVWDALRQGDDEAFARLWERYFDRIVQLARQRMGQMNRRVADEEDVALSVLDCLNRGVAKGRFESIADRDGLWRMLMKITSQKVIDRYRHEHCQTEGGGEVRGESVLIQPGEVDARGGFDVFAGDEPDPAFLAALEEEHQRLLQALSNDGLRQVALWRMEGYTNKEVASRLGITVGAVERKFQLVRAAWSQALRNSGD